MITFQEHTGFIRVEEYSLAAWLAEVETVINQGYKFDFESNEGYPTGFGSMYTAMLVPIVSEVEPEGEVNVPLGATVDIPIDAPEVQPSETSIVVPVVTKRKNAKN